MKLGEQSNWVGSFSPVVKDPLKGHKPESQGQLAYKAAAAKDDRRRDDSVAEVDGKRNSVREEGTVSRWNWKQPFFE